MKRFQKHWIYGYEEVEDACIFLDIRDRLGERISDLMMKYDDNPSSDILVKIKERKDAFCFLCYYIDTKYWEPSLLKHEDGLLEEAHPSPPSHEPPLHNISESEKDED